MQYFILFPFSFDGLKKISNFEANYKTDLTIWKILKRK